jgi:Cupin
MSSICVCVSAYVISYYTLISCTVAEAVGDYHQASSVRGHGAGSNSPVYHRIPVDDSVAAGTMDAGIAQENASRQNITFQVKPGQVFTVPQGLLHYNHNNQCIPNMYLQTFNNADPGALSVTNALAMLRDSGDAGAAAILASNAEFVEASMLAAFDLDQACLKKCGFPETGAPGDGLGDLPDNLRVLLGLGASGNGNYGE